MPTKVDYSGTYDPDASETEDDASHGSFEDVRGPLWDYLVDGDSETTIEWSKLLLVDQQDLPKSVQQSSHLRHARRRLRALDKTPVEVLVDFMKQLWRHAVGDQHNKGYIDSAIFTQGE